jgi:hypothetical protein
MYGRLLHATRSDKVTGTDFTHQGVLFSIVEIGIHDLALAGLLDIRIRNGDRGE